MRSSRAFARAVAAASAASAPLAFTAAGFDGPAPALAPPAPALSPKEFRALTVARVEQLTADTKRVTLTLPSEGVELGGSTASCVVVRAMVDGKEVVRPYTPTTPARQRGTVDLIVKTYPKGKVSKCVTIRRARMAAPEIFHRPANNPAQAHLRRAARRRARAQGPVQQVCV